MSPVIRVRVEDATQVGEARRAAAQVCEVVGFDAGRSGQVAIVVTELATNLVKHAHGGELLMGPLEGHGVSGIEILSVDRGPGLSNPGECMRDGYSTSGSPGTGLGAIRRISSHFDMFTAPGAGTIVLSRIWEGRRVSKMPEPAFEVGAVCLPAPGEAVSGDSWAVRHGSGMALLVVADGLGHGPAAAEASAAAVDAFERGVSSSPGAMVERLHAALRGGRGAAVAVAELRADSRIVRYAGVGNISGVIVTPEWSRSLISYNGTAGVTARKIQEFTYPWPENALLVMHSDGIATRWTLDAYPGLRARDPSVIAAVLARDHARGRDDLTVLTARERSKRP
ncbi:MAG: SpoIIE family protein phosphatase [Vicinamibacterales bacterium]